MKSKLFFILAIGALIGVSYFLNRETIPHKGHHHHNDCGHHHDDCDHGDEQEHHVFAEATFEPGATVVVETDKGSFEFMLYQQDMPITTQNFIDLATRGFYDNTVFHRYVEGFVIQGGQGREGEEVAPRIPFEHAEGLVHVPGAVAMARVGDDYDSASSQFYVCLNRREHLDGQYAIFGQVTSGMEVVEELREGDRIISVRIAEASQAQ